MKTMAESTKPNRQPPSLPVVRVLQVEDNQLDAELVLAELDDDGLSYEVLLVDDEARYSAALRDF
jgi:hypothetical protein